MHPARKDIISQPEYWVTGMEVAIFNALIPHLYPGVVLPELGEPMPFPAKHIYQELATKCGTSVRIIRLMAAGKYRGRLDELVKVCVALGIGPQLTFHPTDQDIV